MLSDGSAQLLTDEDDIPGIEDAAPAFRLTIHAGMVVVAVGVWVLLYWLARQFV